MADLIIRNMQEKDIMPITGAYHLDLYGAFIRKSFQDLNEFSRLLRAMSSKRLCLVAEMPFMRTAGYGLLIPSCIVSNSKLPFYLSDFYVHKYFRGKGVGTKLLEGVALKAKIEGRGIELSLPSGENYWQARNFYFKRGFQPEKPEAGFITRMVCDNPEKILEDIRNL